MKKKSYRKYLVIGVIILFILTAAAPIVIGYNMRKTNIESANRTDKIVVEQDYKSLERQGILNKPLSETIVLAPNSTFFNTNDFKEYKAYREAHGQTIICESLEHMMSPDADQVRDFLKTNYLDGKQRYLLIFGDENLIPCKHCFGSVYSEYYYGDLDGDWDKDNDGRFGEFRDDKVDFLNPEFLVGRLPGSNLAEIDTMLNRTIKFEKDKGNWKRNMLLATGSISKSGDSSLVMNLIDWFSTPFNYKVTTMSDDWILQKPDIILNTTSFRKTWSEGTFGLVYAISHGNSEGLYYFSTEYFHMRDVQNLNPDYPAVFVSLGCLTNQQYVGKTLGKELVLNRTVASVASTTLTSPGIYTPISGAWAETYFPHQYLRKNQNVGMAIQTTKAKYYLRFVCWRLSSEAGNQLQTNLLSFMIYGDPLLQQS